MFSGAIGDSARTQYPLFEWETVSNVASPKIWEGPKISRGAKMLDFRQKTLFCFGYRLLKHKMTICSENFWGAWPSGNAYGNGVPLTVILPSEDFSANMKHEFL